MTKDAVSSEVFLANAAKLSFVLAAFHTCFNLINTGILIWFIPQIEKFVCYIIKPKANVDEEDTRLLYISSGIMKTPEISVLQAQKEIALFAVRIQRMYSMVRDLFQMSGVEAKNDDFIKLYSRIEKYEDISDNMEIEIARYLEQVSDAHLSDETKAKIRSMMRQISEIESIGDACYNLARTLHRKQEQKKVFTEKQTADLLQIMQLTDDALTQMNHVLPGRREERSITKTNELEYRLNEMRDHLKAENINAINDRQYDYAVGTMFTDLINECEKLGDYVVNVVEARLGK